MTVALCLVALASLGLAYWTNRQKDRQVEKLIDLATKERELLLNRVQTPGLIQTVPDHDLPSEIPPDPDAAEIEKLVHGQPYDDNGMN